MILFLDFETTGLVNKSQDFMAQPGIVQIGAIRMREDGEEDNSFYTLVNPEFVTWEPGALKTHGITPDAVKDAPTFFEIGPALSTFALGCDAWAGYNSKFDRDVLWFQLLKYGLERTFPWPPQEIDVMKIANRAMEQQGKRGTKNPKLTEIYEHLFGEPLKGAHNALEDIRATARVYRELVK